MEKAADGRIWINYVCIWSLIALHLWMPASFTSDCPLDFSNLDFSEAILACTEPNNGSCCRYINVLVAIAMSQYVNSTGTLALPEHWRDHCLNMTLVALETNGIPLDISLFCGVKAAITAFQGCNHLTSMKDILQIPGFLEVKTHCAQKRLTKASCDNCLHSSEGFLSSSSQSHDGESIWAQCGITLFVAIGSLGDPDYAMDKANCLFDLQRFGGLLQPQSRCPFKFESWQIKDITDACDIAEEKLYTCCLLSWITLQIATSDTGKPLQSFLLSTRQATACLKDLTSKLKGHRSSIIAFQSCRLPASSIYRESSQGCNNISTVSQFIQALKKKDLSFSFVEDSCNEMKESCDTCRTAIQKAAYVAAGPNFDLKTVQSCVNLAFLVLAKVTTTLYAARLGSCLYAFSVSTPEAKPYSFMPTPLLPPAPKHGLSSSTSQLYPTTHTKTKSSITLTLAAGIGVTGATLMLFLLFVILIRRKRIELQKSKCQTFIPHWSRDHTSSSDMIQSNNWKYVFRLFKYQEIQRATDNFGTVIGKGGFGTVYKARFKGGLVAAVKRMQKSSREGENGFSKELELLRKLHHRHLVTLLGFCAEKHERLLVYEYMENGSLKDHLQAQTKTSLSWRTRLQIATGVAAGLEYLHFYCDPPLCHGDIKSSNILLDGNFNAKVGDFGLARTAPSDCSKLSAGPTHLFGTPAGYIDPEYAVTRALTEKSDVYSFGVLLFEIVTGRNAIHEGRNLVEWAQKYITTNSGITRIVDPDLGNMFNARELQDLINIANLCTQKEGETRPTMRHVLKLLHEMSPA
ncbi:hypothetical protein O6H91_21G047600 [Diphasiastrum complanatum]|uniref:Uncharacterized protein n=1 Tax=Diphasiastrum complanatum TaxID=34168 RepID=A0ACC2AK83_DIPCM|nr:hypothetical protein O6H91_21G047600 [Diphasiastrum complanatum]